MLADRERLDPRVVEEMFDDIALLVLEGDAAALAAKVAEMSAARPTAPESATAPPARSDEPVRQFHHLALRPTKFECADKKKYISRIAAVAFRWRGGKMICDC